MSAASVINAGKPGQRCKDKKPASDNLVSQAQYCQMNFPLTKYDIEA
jgi:hypothetical protein